MYKGSCLCGGVSLEVSGAISDIIHCHCSLCRKSTGSAFATNGFIKREDLHIVQGQPLLSFYEFRPGKKRYFCQVCASPVYSENMEDAGRYRLRLGILDSEISERPISHNFVSSKACWDSLGIELPCYDSHEPSRYKS